MDNGKDKCYLQTSIGMICIEEDGAIMGLYGEKNQWNVKLT